MRIAFELAHEEFRARFRRGGLHMGLFRRRSPSHSNAADEPRQNPYADMRAMALNVTPEQLERTAPDDEVIGAVIDLAYPEGAVTLVSIPPDVSMYFSGGGGAIGLGGHASIAATGRKLVSATQQHLELFGAADLSMPAAGMARMHAITGSGTRTLTAAEDDLGNRRHPAADVFWAAQFTITAIRESGAMDRAPS